MLAELINLDSPKFPPQVRITQKNEPDLLFSVSCFGRPSFNGTIGVFDQLNKYWAQLPENKQLEIYSVYREVVQMFGCFWEKGSFVDGLNGLCVKLIDLHPYDDVYDFMRYRLDTFSIPSSIDASYIDDVDKRWTRKQTYLANDYAGLVCISIILRAMLPVWGEFITNTRNEVGTQFKEYYAFKLVLRSELFNTPAFIRLSEYIEATVGANKENNLAIIEGISSEDYLLWMTAMVCVRRLTLGDISGRDPKAHIVTFIHKFIQSRTSDSDVSPDSKLKFKRTGDGGTDLEAKLSSLERYKVKRNISIGSEMEMEVGLADTVAVAKQICPDIDLGLLARSVESASILNNQRLLDPQINLMRWVMSPAVSAKGILYLSKETIVRMLGITQAILITRGYPTLGLLTTAYVNQSATEHFVTPMFTKSRIPEELRKRLDEVYPYMRNSQRNKQQNKSNNLVLKTIEHLDDELSQCSWILSSDNDLIQMYSPHTLNRRISIPGDIKIQLTKLCIDIGSRAWFSL